MLAYGANYIKFAVTLSWVTDLPYFPFIDGMRAIAVLGVILFHFELGIPGGYIGVDVFFVLSGFLITTILASRLQQPAGEFFGHFYERRARRILPALILMLLLTFAAAYGLLLPKDMEMFSKSMRDMAVFFSNFHFSREVGYFDAPAAAKPLLHTWSLAVEEQFYLLFPPVLYLLARLFKGRGKPLLAVLGIAFVASLAVNLILIQHRPEGAFFLPQARAWELLAGSFVALVGTRHQPNAKVSALVSLIAIAMLAVCMFGYTQATRFPGIAAVPPVLASALLIWANLKHTSFVARVLSWRSLVYIGLISYGLYLYHWPILVFTRLYFIEPPIWTHAISLPILFVLAALSFHFVEEPIRHGRWLRRRRTVLLTALVVLLATFGLGELVGKTGLPSRFDEAVQRYSSAGEKKQYKKICQHEYAVPGTNTSVCVVGTGEVTKPDFLVWGDSHAGSLIPAMQVMAEQYGKTGWVFRNTGCPPMVGTERIDQEMDKPCLQIAKDALTFIKQYHIKSVLLASRWDMYARGWEIGSEEVTREPVIEYNGMLGMEALQQGLPATRAAMRKLGVQPWVMRQVPPQLTDVPTALATAEYFGRDRMVLRREAQPIRDWHAPVVAVLEAGDARHVLDPMPFFCPEGAKFCEIEKDGESLYSDNDHLSIYGSRYLAPVFEPFFKSMQ